MPSERDIYLTDLGETIPEVLRGALIAGRSDVVRGLTAVANTMWQATNPAVRLLELMAEAVREGAVVSESYVYGVHIEVMNSRYGELIVQDFVDWGLLGYGRDDDGDLQFEVPAFWRPYFLPDDTSAPDLGIESLGRLLGICCRARHEDSFGMIGLSSYIPIRLIVTKAIGTDGRVAKDNAKRDFTRNTGYDGDRRWLDLLYTDGERVAGQRLFVDIADDTVIINPDAIRTMELVRNRTNDLVNQRFRGP
jgi:hypothetical protein